MKILQLQEPITIWGRNIFGRRSSITFCPRPKSRLPWIWGNGAPIESGIAELRHRRVRLYSTFDNSHFEVYEHVGPLQYFGLKGVSVTSSLDWPPYHGRCLELWHELKDNCCEVPGQEIKWETLRQDVRWEYPHRVFGGRRAFTEIHPSRTPDVKIDVSCSYPGIGSGEMKFSITSRAVLEDICAAKSLGWPSWLYYPSQIAGGLGIWPHHDTVCWAKRVGENNAIDAILHHRAQDILGLLSLLCRDGLVACHVVSQYSGHEADFRAIQMAARGGFIGVGALTSVAR